MKSLSLLFALLFAYSCAQTTFVRVWFVATGEPSTPSYFDYNPATGAVLRIQTISDQQFVTAVRNNAGVTISALASDDKNAYSIITFLVVPNLVALMLNLNQATCALTSVVLPFGTGLGLAVDPVDKLIFWNYKAVTNVTVNGINKMNYDGTNITNVFTYPGASSNWLAVDLQRQRLYTSLSSNTVTGLQLQSGLTSLSFPTQGCQAASCNIELIGGVVDQNTGRIYYPDATGIQTFDANANATVRSLTITTYTAKSLALDNQNGLLFIQMNPLGGQFTAPIFVVSVNLQTGVANAGSLKQIPGLLATNNNAGNMLALTQ
jgi:hypothetical protein